MQSILILFYHFILGEEHNFNRYSHVVSDTLGIGYDYGSVMHYGKRAFSKNGEITLQAIGNPSLELGQRVTFSEKDVIQINALYDCQSNTSECGAQGYISFARHVFK